MRALLRIELDGVIPPARAQLTSDKRSRHLTRPFEVVGVAGRLVRVQVRHPDDRRPIALDLDPRRPFAHLRTPVAEILCVLEVVAALRGHSRPVELDRLAQRRSRALAQDGIVTARRKAGRQYDKAQQAEGLPTEPRSGDAPSAKPTHSA